MVALELNVSVTDLVDVVVEAAVGTSIEALADTIMVSIINGIGIDSPLSSK